MHPARAGRILAVDPGSEKCGLALLEADGSVVERSVFPVSEVGQRVKGMLSPAVEKVVLGSGTGSNSVAAVLGPICRRERIPLAIVGEEHTTAMARVLYFRENPPRGWRRLIPISFQTPPRPYDDYGAVVIGRRYLESRKGERRT